MDSNPNIVKPLEPIKTKSGMSKKLNSTGHNPARDSFRMGGEYQGCQVLLLQPLVDLLHRESITASSLKVGEIIGVPDENLSGIRPKAS